MTYVRMQSEAAGVLEGRYAITRDLLIDAMVDLSPLVAQSLALLERPGQGLLTGPVAALQETANGLASDKADLAWRLDWITSTDVIEIERSTLDSGYDATSREDAEAQAWSWAPGAAQPADEPFDYTSAEPVRGSYGSTYVSEGRGQSGSDMTVSEVGHLLLDGVGMFPLLGNVADGANAAWYAAEEKYLDAALSSMAMIPAVGQAVTVARPAVTRAASGVVFRNLDDAATWVRRWLEGAGVLRAGDESLALTDDALERADELLYRGDDFPHLETGRQPDSRTAHVDVGSGDLIPANPNGNSQIYHHVRGGEPVKSNSPYTSFSADPQAAANFGEHTAVIDRSRLEADIASGRVSDVEVISTNEINEQLQLRVDEAQQRFDANPTQRNRGRVDSATTDLRNADRANEYLVLGTVPSDYVTVGYGG